MNRRCLVPACLLAVVTRATADDADTAAAIRSDVEEHMKSWRVPGVAMAVVANSRPVLVTGLGVCSINDATEVTAHTLFPLASLTKSFTAAVVLSLVSDGRVSLDAPVTSVLPEFRVSDPWVTREATLRDLLTHGINVERADLLWEYCGLGASDVLARIPGLKATGSFRRYNYSNLNYVVLGHALEKLTGESFASLLRARVLDPLGMTHSQLVAPTDTDRTTVAKGHELRGDELVELQSETWPVAAPAIGLWSSAAEMKLWVEAVLQAGRSITDRAQFADRFPEMLRPQIPMVQATKDANGLASEWSSYGFGWIITQRRSELAIEHAGIARGHCSYIRVIPSLGVGIVVLASRAGTTFAEAIVNRAEVLLRGGVPVGDDEERERAREREESALNAKMAQKLKALAKVPFPGGSAGICSGKYKHPAYGTLAVRPGLKSLEMTLERGLTAPLSHIGSSCFLVEDGSRWWRTYLVFGVDLTGYPVRVTLDIPGHAPTVFDREAD